MFWSKFFKKLKRQKVASFLWSLSSQYIKYWPIKNTLIWEGYVFFQNFKKLLIGSLTGILLHDRWYIYFIYSTTKKCKKNADKFLIHFQHVRFKFSIKNNFNMSGTRFRHSSVMTEGLWRIIMSLSPSSGVKGLSCVNPFFFFKRVVIRLDELVGGTDASSIFGELERERLSIFRRSDISTCSPFLLASSQKKTRLI